VAPTRKPRAPAQRKARTASGLARRLRALRGQNGWSLSVVAARTGIAKSTLSKIENGLMSPTLDLVMRIVHALDIDATELFAAPERRDPVPVASVARFGGGAVARVPGADLEVMFANRPAKRMEIVHLTLRSGKPGRFGGAYGHRGEEFALVLKGTARLHLFGCDPIYLALGDSVYFDSRTPHVYVTDGSGTAELLLVWANPGRPADAAERDRHFAVVSPHAAKSLGRSLSARR
jgi:transcriptional regulator with XRE-family HTH domain